MADSPTLPIYEAIKKAGEHRPRYLFRYWSPESGSDSRLNTTTEITPHAFQQNDEGFKSIFEVPERDLADSIASHLRGLKTPLSYVSSWSASLPFVLARSALSTIRRIKGVHIAIVDTQKLEDNNNVHWCASEHLKPYMNKTLYPHEYHILGTVSGSGYQAVPIETFRGLPGMQEMLVSRIKESEAETLEKAIRIGKSFKPALGLVVAAHVIAMRYPAMPDMEVALDRLLESFEVWPEMIDPWHEESRSHVDATPAVVDSSGWIETQHANELLRNVVNRKALQGEKANAEEKTSSSGDVQDNPWDGMRDEDGNELERDEDDEGGRKRKREASAGRDRKTEGDDQDKSDEKDDGEKKSRPSTRSTPQGDHIPWHEQMNREAYDLYIDMVGAHREGLGR